VNTAEWLRLDASGDPQAGGRLYAALYPEIKRLAHLRLRDVGGVTDLNTTQLANEGFLKLADAHELRGESRLQFLAYVGKLLRSVVLDHLRERAAQKRGGLFRFVTLSQAETFSAGSSDSERLIALDAALERLKKLDPALYQTLELCAYTGLEISQIAELRQVSSRTVNRDLKKARALISDWLDT
jgi:RNA polymerase sigma factor (TIGR02999 family)